MTMKTNIHRRYQYTLTRSFGTWQHRYLIECRYGATEFWVSEYDKDGVMAGHEPQSGLESHFRQPPDYMAEHAPSHPECHALKAPCWHDGTSLYAQENLLPLWRERRSEMEVFDWLDREADRLDQRFAPQLSDPA